MQILVISNLLKHSYESTRGYEDVVPFTSPASTDPYMQNIDVARHGVGVQKACSAVPGAVGSVRDDDSLRL
jgi:hypothetical protein